MLLIKLILLNVQLYLPEVIFSNFHINNIHSENLGYLVG